MKKLHLGIVIGTTLLAVAGCSDAGSESLSKASENFGVDRRIVIFDGATGKYLLNIEGRCAADRWTNSLEITCETAKDQYKKHYVGLGDDESYFVEQLNLSWGDVYNYKVVYKPEVIAPDVQLGPYLPKEG